MIYRTDNGTNTLLLEILSDLTKNPSISFSTGTTVTPTSEDFTYEVPSSIWVGDSSFTFTVSDSTGSETFTVYQAANTDINVSLQETGERTYTLAVASSSTDISDNTVDTIDDIAAEYPTLTAGERVRTFFGKIKKFLADLKDLKYDKAGGHISGGMYPDGGIYTTAEGLPERNGHAYLLGIDPFSQGGQMKWSTSEHVTVGRASTAGTVDRAYFGNQAHETHDCNVMTYNGLVYYNANGPSTSIGATTNDGALYSQAYNTNLVGQIAQDYRNGRLFVRGKNNGTWQAWKTLMDSGNILRYLGYTTSSTAKNFSMTSDAAEIVIACKFIADNTRKMFCTSVPKNLLEGAYGTKYEVWVGGGKNTSTTANSGAARVLVNVSLASATVVTVQGVDASSGATSYLSSAYFYVYQR